MANTDQTAQTMGLPTPAQTVAGVAPTQPPDWDGLAAAFQADAARPGHAPAPVAGLDAEQTARVLTVVAGQWGRYAPPAVPALPARVAAPLNRLLWVPLEHRALERDAFALLPRAWRPALAARLLDTCGFHPHPDAWLPHAEDVGLHPDLWPFAGPALEDVDSAVFASWTTDAMAAALERWDLQDKAATDAFRLAVWEEAGARLKARLLDIALDPVAALCDDVRALAWDPKTGVELRSAARRALSRWGKWESNWPLTDEEQAVAGACAAASAATGLMGRLLGGAKPKGTAPVLDAQRIPYAALGLATMEMPKVAGWVETDWWSLLIASAPRALWDKAPPRPSSQAMAVFMAGSLRAVPPHRRAAVWNALCAQAEPVRLFPAMSKPSADLPMLQRAEWDSVWQDWRRYGIHAPDALYSLFLPPQARASWRALPPDWASVTQQRHAAVINLLSTLQGETR
jgi:hypothetical protein